MTKQELLQSINLFLEEGPLTEKEVKEWKQAIPTMEDADLVRLLQLFKQKEEILLKANKVILKITEDAIKLDNDKKKRIPTEVYVTDMEYTAIIKTLKRNLIALINNDEIDVFTQFDQLITNATIAGDDPKQEFEEFSRAILFNKEVFTKEKISVGRWLVMYDAFRDSTLRRGIDRINFVHQNSDAKKLNKQETTTLLKILKLYDFLLDPTVVDIALGPEVLTKIGQKKIKRKLIQPQVRPKKITPLAQKQQKITPQRRVVPKPRPQITPLPQVAPQPQKITSQPKKIAPQPKSQPQIAPQTQPKVKPQPQVIQKSQVAPQSKVIPKLKQETSSNINLVNKPKDQISSKPQTMQPATPAAQVTSQTQAEPIKKAVQRPSIFRRRVVEKSQPPPPPAPTKLIRPIKSVESAKPTTPPKPAEPVKPITSPKLSENEQQIKKLQELIKQYSNDSLVQEAIREEIKKIKSSE